MRFIPLLTFLLLWSNLLLAQVVHIEYLGDPLSAKERLHIEEVLKYETAFYAQFGLSDTLDLKLRVFNRKAEGRAYLDEIGVHLPLRIRGVYMTRRKEAVILGREKGDKTWLGVVSHELSHHFAREIGGKHIPSWLNEGLSEYFKHCQIKKKEVRHILPSYERGRIRTMYMLGDVDLLSFINSDRKMFMERQFTDERYAYILSHALVTFWIEEVPRDVFKEFISILKDVKEYPTASDRINRVYPGGFPQFEQDFVAYCK